MAKLSSTFCALGVLTVTSALAQQPAGTTTFRPAVAPSATDATAPAPIEPPLQVQNVEQVTPPASTDAAPIVPGAITSTGPAALSPTATRLNEFQGDEIGLVLRTLARQAKLNMVVSDKVATTAGTVTMRIEDRTPREAIDIIVTSKSLVMDEVNGVVFVKTQEERLKEPTESGNFTLSYAMAKDILPLLTSQLTSGVAPQMDLRTNTVFFRETRTNMAQVLLFLQSIDRPTQQVMIEARLVEVTANPRQSYGINWAGVVGGASTPQTFRYGGTTTGSSTIQTTTLPGTTTPVSTAVPSTLPAIITDTTTGLFKPQDILRNATSIGTLGQALAGQFAILSIPQMSATLRLLNEDSDAEFLANPRVVTANNQKADIKITQARPVPQLNFNEQTAQAVFSGFADKEFGNTLEVTPSINKDDFVSMLVKPEISTTPGDVTFTFGGAQVSSPIIDKRTLTSNVLIRSGDTLAIGGLLQDEVIKSRTKVPVLGDIPLVGYLFQEKRNVRTKRNLLVFVTPTIIQQGYGTGLEDQVSGLSHSGEEYADPNGWRNNARGAVRLTPTSNRQVAADVPKPGVAKAPRRLGYRVSAGTQSK
jgi:type IV pilus assembly protein PilQ